MPAPDQVRQCANKCVFCFIDGNPEGARNTLWLRDETFIKMRPTARFGIGLALGAWAITNGHPKMKELYEKLDEIGQRRMTALLFVCGMASAAANELVWRNSSTRPIVLPFGGALSRAAWRVSSVRRAEIH